MQRENWSKERKLKTTQNKSKRGETEDNGMEEKSETTFLEEVDRKIFAAFRRDI